MELFTRWLMTACRVMKSATESRYPTITWRAESKKKKQIQVDLVIRGLRFRLFSFKTLIPKAKFIVKMCLFYLWIQYWRSKKAGPVNHFNVFLINVRKLRRSDLIVWKQLSCSKITSRGSSTNDVTTHECFDPHPWLLRRHQPPPKALL